MSKVQVMVGDITKSTAAVIVNSANQSLMPGSGLCGAIYKVAGEGLKDACLPFAPLAIGEAIITDGFRLPAQHIIHAVAPKWYLNHPQRGQQLASCYQESLQLAEKHQLRSIAFPCIGMGTYRCPLEIGIDIAVSTVCTCISNRTFTGDVVFVCANDEQLGYYQLCLKNHTGLIPHPPLAAK